jgi:hypothetical protein
VLLAEKRDRNLPAISDAPANPKLRKPVVVPTWYPNAPTIDGAAPLVLRPGERRDGVDIRIAKVAAYCTEGTAEGPAGPAPLSFWIESQQASSGMSRNSGMYTATAGGKTGDDGKFRICGLRPGQYRLTTLLASGAPAGVDPVYGMTPVTIVDEDVRGVKALARLGTTLSGEVVWDGTPPDKAIKVQLWLSLDPMTRSSIMGEKGRDVRPNVPGEFTMPAIFMDDYAVKTRIDGPGVYVKAVLYGGVSAMFEPMRFGSMIGNQGLRVIVGHDGGTLSTQVADKDGNPIGDAHLVVIPANAASEAMVSQTMILGETNQDGLYSTPSLAPGKYYVLALNAPVDDSPECIGRLWRARAKAKEVEIGPNATAQAALTPISID